MVATSMRILLVTPLFFPSLSGAAVYFDTLSRALVAQYPAARVTILTRALADAPRLERRGRVRVLRLLPGVGRRTAIGERAAGLATVLIMLLVSLALRSQVVHYHTLVSYRAIHRLAPLFPAPVVGDMRDLAARDEGASLAYYRHCSRLICASENILEFMTAGGFTAERLVHIPIPFIPPVPAPPARVAGARARFGLARATPYLLFAGAIIPGKGVGELMEAMPLVWPRLPDLHLALAGPLTPAGDALFADGFRGRVAREPRLHYLGAVPHDDLMLLLQGADMFILPSRTEGLGRSCLEAMALGRRVILPPGVPEFLRDCPEAVLEEVTPKAIAARIERTWQTGSSPAYPLERHDAHRVAEKTFEVYRQVVG